MSTENPTPDPKPEAPKPETPAQETDWRAEARKWEARAKENKDAAARLAEIEETQKTEAQKQAEALEAANKELAKYKHREQVTNWAKEITQDEKFKGVPANALRGNTREELESHAEVLAALIKPSGPVVVGQEKSPSHVGADPLREFTRGLFDQAKNQ